MTHILSYLCNHPWVIKREHMETIQAIVERETEIEAVAAKLGRPLANTSHRVEQRGSTAIITIDGPIFRKANLFTEISGATSTQILSTDFQAALEDDRVQSILFNIDSPGGEAKGVGELAARIYQARKVKPVWAYIGSEAASGGYWLAAAVERIVMHQTAFAGSIGVLATVTDDKERREKAGVRTYQIVSSQSPLKRIDPSTDAGQAQLQEMVDGIAAIFIGQVAAYRSTSTEHVMADYGKGFVVSAQKAVEVGMADELGDFEGTLAELNSREGKRTFSLAAAAPHVEKEKENTMAEDNQPDLAAVRREAVTAERARIQAILDSEEAKGREAQARHFAFKTDWAPEQAREALAQAPVAAKAPATDPLTAHMRTVANPAVGTQADGHDDVADEISKVAAFLPSTQRRRTA